MPCTAKRQIEIDNLKESEAARIAESVHDADLFLLEKKSAPRGAGDRRRRWWGIALLCRH